MKHLLFVSALLFVTPAVAQDQAVVVNSCGSIVIKAGTQHFRTINLQGQTCNTGGGPTVACSQATSYLSRTSGGDEGGNSAPIIGLICGLVNDGVWGNLDAFYLPAQQNLTDAKLNLVNASYSLTGTATFTTYQGLSGFPAGGLDTHFNPATAPSPHFVKDSASIGAWSPVAQDGVTVGSTVGVGFTQLAPNAFGSFYFDINSNTTIGSAIATKPHGNLFHGDRSSSSGVDAYADGLLIGTVAFGSSAPYSSNIIIGDRVAADKPYFGLISAAFVGSSLGAGGQAAIYNRLSTYMASLPDAWSAVDALIGTMTLSNGGLTVTPTNSQWKTIRSILKKSSGKLYVEFINTSPTAITNPENILYGIADYNLDPANYLGATGYSIGLRMVFGNIASAGFTSNYNSTFNTVAQNDTMALAVDFDTGKVWLAKNNVWSNSSDPVTATLPIASFVPATTGSLSAALSFQGPPVGVWTLKNTASTQKYAAPSGFTAWDGP